MADPKEIAEQIEKLAHALKTSKEFINSFNESIDVTKQIMLDVRKVYRSIPGSTGAKMLNEVRSISRALKDAKTTVQAMDALKQAEIKYQGILNSKILAGTKEIKITEEALKNVVQIRKQLGQSATAEVFGLKELYLKFTNFGKIGKNFGVSMQAAGHHLSNMNGVLGKFGGSIGKTLMGVGTKLSSLSVPVVGWIITASLALKNLANIVIKYAKSIWETFNAADTAATQFRMKVGFLRNDMKFVDKEIRNVAISLANVGANFEMAYNSVLAIVQEMGSIGSYSKEMTNTLTVFTSQLGISAEKSIKVLRTFGMIEKTTMRSQRNMLGFLGRLSAAAGTNLHEVMADIAEFSQSNYRFMRGSSEAMAKAAVEARKMGTSLGSTGKTMSALLNFTQSINDEMESSVLIGESVNLQYLRRLSYLGDIQSVNEEILRLSRKHGFESMDPIQMQSFARALGKTEDELGKILQVERERISLEEKMVTDVNLRNRVEGYRKLLDMDKKRAEVSGQQYLLDLQRQANQTRMASIQQQWNKLLQQLAEDWLPMIDEGFKQLMPVLQGLSKLIIAMAKPTLGLVKMLSGAFQMEGALMRLSWEDFQEGWKTASDGVTDYALGKWGNFVNELEKDIKPGSPHRLGQMFLDGFVNAQSGIEKSLMEPIDKVKSNLKGIGNIIGDSLLASPSRAFEFNLRNSIGRAAADFSNIIGSSPISPIFERPVPPGFDGIKPITTNRQEQSKLNDIATESSVMKMVESINRLREDLLNGNLAANVYLDSQRLTEGIDRATRFRGGYGVNNNKVV